MENVNENDRRIVCPRCGSENVTCGKKGFSGKKAIIGGLLTGGIGLAAGFLGSNKLQYTCLICGNVWDPAKEWEKNHNKV